MNDFISKSTFRKVLTHELEIIDNQEVRGEISSIISMLDNHPVAFDIENIINRVDNIKKKSPCIGIDCRTCKYTNNCYEGERSKDMAIDKAVTIIKKATGYNKEKI